MLQQQKRVSFLVYASPNTTQEELIEWLKNRLNIADSQAKNLMIEGWEVSPVSIHVTDVY